MTFPSPDTSCSITGASSNEEAAIHSRKRTVSEKRAEQNRKAQKAFRQKKKEHVKILEAEVAKIPLLQNQIDLLLAENARLRAIVEMSSCEEKVENIDMTFGIRSNEMPSLNMSGMDSELIASAEYSSGISSPQFSVTGFSNFAPSLGQSTTEGNSPSSTDHLYLLPPAFGGETPLSDVHSTMHYSHLVTTHDILISHNSPMGETAYNPVNTSKNLVGRETSTEYTGHSSDDLNDQSPKSDNRNEDTDDETVFHRVHSAVNLKPECKQLKDEVVTTLCDLMERTTCRDERFDNFPAERLRKFWSRLLIYASLEAFDKCDVPQCPNTNTN